VAIDKVVRLLKMMLTPYSSSYAKKWKILQLKGLLHFQLLDILLSPVKWFMSYSPT
jgi:hypothetical protein